VHEEGKEHDSEAGVRIARGRGMVEVADASIS
jgi:hypothetical protein